MILQTPAGLKPGDHFRFVFVTDGTHNATSPDIAVYDSFVNAQAGGATYGGVVVDWLAIGSTGSVDAIDHIGQTNTPVYLSDGTLVTTFTMIGGLWFQSVTLDSLNHEINLDLAGNHIQGDGFVWTGTNPFGTGFGGPLGAARSLVGSVLFANASWVASGSDNGVGSRPFYGISSVLSVPQVVPEPSTLTLLGTGLGVSLALGRARHRRNQRQSRSAGGSPICSTGR